MKPMTFTEVRQAVRGRRLTPGEDVRITGASVDGRTASAGDVFFAIRGQRFDGHDFLAQAADAGCAAAVVQYDAGPFDDDTVRLPGGLIGVEDTRQALGALAASYRSRLTATVVAVTGSNGKTTVKRMIDHILGKDAPGRCSPKSFNNDIGVPLALLGADGTESYVVCEIGSSAPGEVAVLGAIAQPDVAVITSIAPAHLEGLGSIERIAAEKASLLGAMKPAGLGVVWGDHEILARAVRAYGPRVVRFGAGDDIELRVTGYQPGEPGARFELNGRLWVDLPVPGRHNAMNALAAIGVAQRFGLDPADAARRLADFAPPEMRLQPVDAGGVRILNDAYNANPASLLAAADVLVERQARRTVCVIGDMRELGSEAEALHRRAGRDLAGRGVSVVIGVGRLGGLVAEEAARAGLEAGTFPTLEEAASKLPGLLRTGDLVLLKASRSVGIEALVEPVREAFAPKTERTRRSPGSSKGARRRRTEAKR